MRRVRAKLTYANVMSSIAVFMVLGGSAYAATTLPKDSVGSKQIKTGGVASSDIRANAVTSSKIKNGSLLSTDFKPGQLVAGAPGPTGPAGSKGDSGAKGDKGDPGNNFTADTTLASGKTLTGQWDAWGAGAGYNGDAVTYRLPLATTPAASTGHYITAGTTANCPGIGQAAPGHLCVYQSTASGSSFGEIYAVEPTGIGHDRGSKDGFQIYFSNGGTGANYAYGSWAMTAP